MEIVLSIDSSRCIRCGKCVKVCPSRLFTRRPSGETVVESVQGCIVCGHCVAVCPEGAVVHSEFSSDAVHPVDYSDLPTAEQMLLLTKVRRSNRAFSSRPVPKESLRQIIEAAHRAPTASNQQQVRFMCITDPGVLKQISDFTLDVFGSLLRKMRNPLIEPFLKRFAADTLRYAPVFERLQREYGSGNDMILRKATAVILIYTPVTSRFGVADANLAYQNGSLMAECLGVAHFYTGFVLSAVAQGSRGALEKRLGIEGRITSGMALGMPQFRYPNYIDRHPVEARFIEPNRG